jgi:hypothetical protein
MTRVWMVLHRCIGMTHRQEALIRISIGDDGFNYNGNTGTLVQGTQAFDRVLSIALKSGCETLVWVLRSFCHLGLF